MDINKFTEKLQEAFSAAQSTAARFGHQQVDVEHREIDPVERERVRAVGHRVGQLGADPVCDGHEVVRHDPDAARGENGGQACSHTFASNLRLDECPQAAR